MNMNKKIFTTCREISDQIDTNLKQEDEFSNDDYDLADPTTVPNNGPQGQRSCQLDHKRVMGRWTKDEHEKFLEGKYATEYRKFDPYFIALRLYGNNWKEVQSYIGTRSGPQIRSHAQKFFIQMQKRDGKKIVNQERGFTLRSVYMLLEKICQE